MNKVALKRYKLCSCMLISNVSTREKSVFLNNILWEIYTFVFIHLGLHEMSSFTLTSCSVHKMGDIVRLFDGHQVSSPRTTWGGHGVAVLC
jgi:hypothetical protein